MRYILVGLIGLLLNALPCLAQDVPRIQGKLVTHATVPGEPGWYPTGWVITNIRQDTTDNINFMLGAGRKLENGWVEFMAQKQYSFHTSQWFFDFRLVRQFNKRMSIFVEIAPFLEKFALYDFVRVDYRLGPINLIAESENIHVRGLDSVGIGPGIGLPPMKLSEVFIQPKKVPDYLSATSHPNFL